MTLKGFQKKLEKQARAARITVEALAEAQMYCPPSAEGLYRLIQRALQLARKEELELKRTLKNLET